MRKALAAVGLLVFAATLVHGEKEIEPDALLGHIKFLAADDLKGRANGSEGLERAGDYIAEQFKSAGLQPGVNGSWFQPFELNAGLLIGPTNSLSFQSRGKTVTLTLGTSYYPLAATGSDKTPSVKLDNVPLVFAGYGLAVPELGYDDYKNVDVSGKAVIVFTHEPQEHDAASRLNGTRPMPQTSLNAKAQLALSKGARLLIAVSDPSHRYDEGQFTLFKSDPDADDQGFPVLRVRRTEMQPLLDAWRLDAAARLIDMDLIPRSEVLTDSTVNYVESISKNRKTVRNVVGILPGSDSARAREAIVIGAHYDHLGRGEAGNTLAAKDDANKVHAGADDNASGTAAVLAIAATLAKEKRHRNVLVALWSGEELGLIGSSAFAAAPPVPLDQLAAYLNFDMVGRMQDNKLTVQATGTSPAWAKLLEQANVAAGFDLVVQEDPYQPTDVATFNSASVPSLTFFTGTHADYHKPSDTPDKIDYEDLDRVVDFAAAILRRVEQTDTPPQFTKVDQQMQSGGGRAGVRVFTGTIPDYSSDVKGLLLGGVIGGGPAEQAGLKKGDVIVEIAGQTIANIYDYTYALDVLKIGQPAKVVYLRDGKKQETTLTPAARK